MRKLERTMTDLTWDDLCDLMCGCPEEEGEDDGIPDESLPEESKQVSSSED